MSLAVSQVERIAKLCDFLAHPGLKAGIQSSVPVSMPQSEGSVGFDAPLWVGLGIVGLWSALDAFAERTLPPSNKSFLSRLASTDTLDVADRRTLEEMDDLRNLFAHNYAGRADSTYFTAKKRHVLAQGVGVSLSSGARFDGESISLGPAHLRHYADRVLEIIEKLT
jgi:hypothetical protein